MRNVIIVVVIIIAVGSAIVWLRSGDATRARADAAPAMGPLEAATNRQGRDLSRGGTATADAAQCSTLCAINPACKAMSFAINADGAGGICFLKSDVPAATENAAVTSAVKAASAPVGGR